VGRFDIHFHRKDAGHAKHVFILLLSAERPESKYQHPLESSQMQKHSAHFYFKCSRKLRTFPLPSSQRQRKNTIISAIFAPRAAAGGEINK
jgi:hypothetical protein